MAAERKRKHGNRSAYGRHLLAIRRFFLQPLEKYSIADLAELWHVHPDDVRDIFHDEELPISADGMLHSIVWADAVDKSFSFHMLRPVDIERALGADFPRVRPFAWRTEPVVIHLPKFITEAIARAPTIPSRIPVAVRVEKLIVEMFTSGGGQAGVNESPRRRSA